MSTAQTPDDPLRGTGRTTADVLTTIAAALREPGRWILYYDHSGIKNAECYRAVIKKLVNALGLRIDVSVVGLNPVIRSPRPNETNTRPISGDHLWAAPGVNTKDADPIGTVTLSWPDALVAVAGILAWPAVIIAVFWAAAMSR